MDNHPTVRIVEVGPRDGLQNIPQHVATDTKTDLIRRLHASGLQCIELTSIVSPRAVPQLRDCRDVLASPSVQTLLKDPSLRLPVLVPNLRGAEIAYQYGVSEVAVFVSASEGFSRANVNCEVAVGIQRARAVVEDARRRGVVVRGYVSCIFVDPFDGPTPHSAVLRAVQDLLSAGCYEVSLGDTTGAGTPAQVQSLLKFLESHGVPLPKLAGHFHDTRGQALANVWEAYDCGIRVFDSSVSGLGGCPYAPGAKGNVATEDIAYMFSRAGVRTGIDIEMLLETSRWISETLSRPSASRLCAALASRWGVHGAAPLSMGLPGSLQRRKSRGSASCLEIDEGLYWPGSNLKISMSRCRTGGSNAGSDELGSRESERSHRPHVLR